MGPNRIPDSQAVSLALADELATSKLGQKLAKILHLGDVLALVGDLGAGKTSLARSIIRTFVGNAKLEVPSPTFSLIQQYERPGNGKGEIWHVDFYRLESRSELWELGLEEGFGQALVIIEWPERFVDHLPQNTLWIKLEAGAKRRERKIIFAGKNWNERLQDAGTFMS